MPVALMLGPNDHGRAIAREEFDAAHRQEGYRYELIEGRVCVSPLPNPPHARLLMWLARKLDNYSQRYPDAINYVTTAARVVVAVSEAATIPEPDLVAYQDYPLDLSDADEGVLHWDELNPLLVVEILSESNADKDLERNVTLYQQVPSLREYWIVDPRHSPSRPSMRVYRRRGSRWQKPIDVAPGETYTTRLLPDFALTLDRRA